MDRADLLLSLLIERFGSDAQLRQGATFMSTTLHPTPTRIALLRDIDAGHLRWNERDGFNMRGVIVNARIDEFDRARWVTVSNAGYRQVVTIAELGREVLAAAGGAK